MDDQNARELVVLKVCLSEIERSRPFLIALIGDRYGWTPPEERMAAAAQEAGFDGDVRGKSITALEIEFGALANPDQVRRTHFYLRKPLPYDKMDAQTAEVYSDAHHHDRVAGKEAAGRLLALKTRLRDEPTLKGRVHEYRVEWDANGKRVTGLEPWGRQVVEDLWRDLDAETRDNLQNAPATWQEQERRTLEEFADQRGRDFSGRRDITDYLSTLAQSPIDDKATWGICVTGESGSGKSALFAHLRARLHERDVVLLTHAAGISLRSTNEEDMLRRWVGELARFLRVVDSPTDKPTYDDTKKRFHELFYQVSERLRVVVLIDALDQLERVPNQGHLAWLPTPWPANARLVATAIPGLQSEALAKRPGTEIKPLGALDRAEAETILAAVYRRYHRDSNQHVIEALLAKKLPPPDCSPAFGNPLWLSIAAEEVNLLDADDFTRAERGYSGRSDERLQAMVLGIARGLPPDVSGLYALMLRRMERAYGRVWVQSLATTVALSRFGWRESDFQKLIPGVAAVLFPNDQPPDSNYYPWTRPTHGLDMQAASSTSAAWDPLLFAMIRRGFRYHLVQRGQGQWDFFHARMRQAVRSSFLVDESSIMQIHDVFGAHLEKLDRLDPLRQSELMFHSVEANNLGRAARMCGTTVFSVEECWNSATAIAATYKDGADTTRNLGVELLRHPGISVEQIVGVCQRLLTMKMRPWHASAQTQCDLYSEMRNALAQACQDRPDNFVCFFHLAGACEALGDLFLKCGQSESAIKHYREGQRAIRTPSAVISQPNAAGTVDSVASRIEEKICVALSNLGRTEEAIEARISSIELRKKYIQPGDGMSYFGVANMLWNVARAYRESSDCPGALRALRDAEDLLATANRGDVDLLLWNRQCGLTQAEIGECLTAQGDSANAHAAFRRAADLFKPVAESNPADLQVWRNFAAIQVKLCQMPITEQSKSAVLQALPDAVSTLNQMTILEPSNLDWWHYLVLTLGILAQQGASIDGVDPLARIRDVLLRLRKSPAAHSPRATETLIDLESKVENLEHARAVVHGERGDLLNSQHEPSAAIREYREGLAIVERLAARNQSNFGLQCNIAVFCHKLANAHQSAGTIQEANTYLRRCHDTLNSMMKAGMKLDPPLAALLEQLNRQF